MSKVVAKDPVAKLVHKCLSVLELAQELGSVAEACRRAGMDRTSFYEWKRRFQTHGLEGLKDLPPVAKNHPFTTPAETVERVLRLAEDNPTWGCNRISDLLALEGIALSAVTIQNLLNKNGLGSRYERLLKLEERALREKIELTPEQIRLIEKANPVTLA